MMAFWKYIYIFWIFVSQLTGMHTLNVVVYDQNCLIYVCFIFIKGEEWGVEVTATALHHQDPGAEGIEVQAQGVVMVVVLEIFLLAYWFATFALIVGLFWSDTCYMLPCILLTFGFCLLITWKPWLLYQISCHS